MMACTACWSIHWDAGNGEVKKRKKKTIDSVAEEGEASDAPLETKKSKKSKKEKPNSENPNLEIPNLDSESKGNDIVSNLVLGLESHTLNDPSFGEVKKKRKRDELEREYEAKKYGVTENQEESDLGKKEVGEKRKTVDNPADMLISEEGFDDESKLLRTIFVGNLPVNVKKLLIREFSKFGEVESVRIQSVPIEDTEALRKVAVLTKKLHKKADSMYSHVSS